MDPNLHFRFAIPGWVTLLSAGLVLWVSGAWVWFIPVIEKQGIAAALTALFGAPAIGYLLNTLVVVSCESGERGPTYDPAFTQFKNRLLALEYVRKDPLLRHTLNKIHPAALVAHFEYRLDPEVLLQWRRRARTGYFAGWSNFLAVISGSLLGLGISIAFAMTHMRSLGWGYWLTLLIPLGANTLVAIILVCAAKGFPKVASDQQMLWARTCSQEHVNEVLGDVYRGGQTRKSDSD